jgi:hypothetical protein
MAAKVMRVLLSITAFTNTSQAQNLFADRLFLLEFKASQEGSFLPWPAIVGWDENVGDTCLWTGVTCSGGRVSALDLGSSCAASSCVPGNVASISGNITWLAALLDLRTLRLDGTRARGGIGLLSLLGPGLRQLSLRSARGVSGELGELASLTGLQKLDLGGTSVHGDVSRLRGLTQLTTLVLSFTAVDGDIGSLASSLPRLTRLELEHSSVSGQLADLAPVRERLGRERASPLPLHPLPAPAAALVHCSCTLAKATAAAWPRAHCARTAWQLMLSWRRRRNVRL